MFAYVCWGIAVGYQSAEMVRNDAVITKSKDQEIAIFVPLAILHFSRNGIWILLAHTYIESLLLSRLWGYKLHRYFHGIDLQFGEANHTQVYQVKCLVQERGKVC